MSRVSGETSSSSRFPNFKQQGENDYLASNIFIAKETLLVVLLLEKIIEDVFN
jgi:hypothetical protein